MIIRPRGRDGKMYGIDKFPLRIVAGNGCKFRGVAAQNASDIRSALVLADFGKELAKRDGVYPRDVLPISFNFSSIKFDTSCGFNIFSSPYKIIISSLIRFSPK